MPQHEFVRGAPHPLGAIPQPEGVNFSLFSEDATEVALLLFESAAALEPYQTIRFDPFIHKTFHFWHVLVKELRAGTYYAFRVDGPSDPPSGRRFNSNKILIGPYARAISKKLWSRADGSTPFDNLATSMRCAVIDTSDYDWEGDQPLNRPIHESIIYEMHVGGFTRSPSSGVAQPGTYTGVVEKIPYLQALGITAVELLPVFEFDDTSSTLNPEGHLVHNYWGYSTVAFFAPHSTYCVDPSGPDHANEFRDMVKALHKAGIEVILDVVFNHTDEGNQTGPTFAFRGIDNRTYYILDPKDRSNYMNYSGVGNTFNCNHPIAQKFIIDCLSYWVKELHVDGFRFDEGSILTRGEDGTPLEHPPVVWQVELDDLLANTKLIAEAWDAAGLYQIGHFPGDRWAQWNGKFRDDVRRFVRGEPGLTAVVASRIGGSSDIFEARSQTPENSINFITCHDGFTLNDLVSYNQKHNEANGEGNRDGNNQNDSWNCGVEGPTGDPAIEQLRSRQIRNFATILLLSRGVPMLLGGDELRRTQLGNNNAYNQDNEVSWIDWTMATKNGDVLRFFQRLIAFRKAHGRLTRPRFYTGRTNERGMNDVTWHGTQLDSPGFSDAGSRALACTIAGFADEADLHVMMNMFWEPLSFQVPVDPARKWRVAIDTFQPSPHDIAEEFAEPQFNGQAYSVRERSVVVLLARAPA
jgi:glycogen operon protein